MDDPQLYETIEAYLRQQMSPAESAAFEVKMAADPALDEQVVQHWFALRTAERLAERSMQEKFAQWRTEADAEEGVPAEVLPKTEAPAQPTPSRKVGLWLLTAALGGGLVGAFWPWGPEKKDSLGKRALLPDTSAIEPPPSQPVAADPTSDYTAPRMFASVELSRYGKNLSSGFRGSTSGQSLGDSLLAQADSLLSVEKYKSAAALLEQILPGSGFEASALKRLAFAYHNLGGHDKAIATYQQYVALPIDSDPDEDDWLLCLYYLAAWPEHEADFEARLDKMTRERHHGYHIKAVRLEQKMRAKGWKK